MPCVWSRVHIDLAVLELRESGDLQKLRKRWWYDKGECAPENDGKVRTFHLELPRPLPAPFQAAATMLLPGEVTATAWLPTCGVVSAGQCSYPVSDARQCTYRVRALFGVRRRTTGRFAHFTQAPPAVAGVV